MYHDFTELKFIKEKFFSQKLTSTHIHPHFTRQYISTSKFSTKICRIDISVSNCKRESQKCILYHNLFILKFNYDPNSTKKMWKISKN